MDLIDTHAHLASSRLIPDLPSILDEAQECGVGTIVSISCDLEDCTTNRELSENYKGVFATAGIHPCYVHEFDEGTGYSLLEAHIQSGAFVAVGEIGLDYFHPPADGSSLDDWKQLQKRVFRRQLEIADALAYPVIIHQRNSFDDTLEMLQDFPDVRAVLHCFSEGPEEAKRALELGCYLSFTGNCTFKSAEPIRESISICPRDRVMVETDSPFLAPVPYRGKRNTPAYVVKVAEQIGACWRSDIEAVAIATSENARRFFRGLS